jgi:hypothetical protein
LEGDFITDLGGGELYYEQNDGSSRRKARVRVRYSNGNDSIFQFSQPVFTRAYDSTLRQFYRHYGIGYSYNAVEGSYCNLSDFRCQILNRAVLDRVLEEQNAEILNVDEINEIVSSNAVYSSVVNYIQSAGFKASGSGTFITYSGSATASANIFEDGVDESYIIHDELTNDVVEYTLNYPDLIPYLDQYPALLTSSFRAALDKIDDTNKSIDDFVNVYGTHVVVFSKLGARMSVDLQVDAKRFEERDSLYTVSEQSLALMFNEVKNTSESERNYQYLKDCNCQFSVTGGDVSIFDNLLDITSFECDSYTPQMKADWLNSIRFDDNDIANSNVEMVDMRVAPIWYFIPNKQLADRVQARITGNLGLVIETLGNDNLINTSFLAHPKLVSCIIGDQDYYATLPSTVDVIAANRHVATICKERVPDISNTEEVYVAYPIYEGRVKLTDGLCIYNNKVYKVEWSFNRFTVTPVDGEVSTEDKIYMNAGVLSVAPSDQLTYQDSHLILGCERPGGITIDGKLGGEMRAVHKHFGHFYLDNWKEYNNLPGWSYTNTLPKEAENYPDYFKGDTYKNRMVRNDNYVYVWNKTEIRYE